MTMNLSNTRRAADQNESGKPTKSTPIENQGRHDVTLPVLILNPADESASFAERDMGYDPYNNGHFGSDKRYSTT